MKISREDCLVTSTGVTGTDGLLRHKISNGVNSPTIRLDALDARLRFHTSLVGLTEESPSSPQSQGLHVNPTERWFPTHAEQMFHFNQNTKGSIGVPFDQTWSQLEGTDSSNQTTVELFADFENVSDVICRSSPAQEDAMRSEHESLFDAEGGLADGFSTMEHAAFQFDNRAGVSLFDASLRNVISGHTGPLSRHVCTLKQLDNPSLMEVFPSLFKLGYLQVREVCKSS